jgi:hypothetical protein
MAEKDIEIKTPYTREELSNMGIMDLNQFYVGYYIFGRGNERFMLTLKKNGEERFLLNASDHRYFFNK